MYINIIVVPFKARLLLSLCNMCSDFTIAGTTGADFLESCVGWSAIVPEFQGHSGISTFRAAISFSETVRNYMGPVLKIAAAASAS
jgi:hypothetical protein